MNMENNLNCKYYHRLIAAFDRRSLDYRSTLGFVRHVSGCEDCREEYEIYNISRYALSEDEALDILNARESEEVCKKINECDYKGLVDLRLKGAMQELDEIRNNAIWQVGLLAVADICMFSTFVLYLIEKF